ncbi:hypothetical protein KPL47_22535 [Clostridium estertheticum]|uniref:hypothetical protein n=1 Tax=Clostridium estertheticum TaxID=238834 RepID=UPI001C0E8EFD|nr:hypothetical protein [Clostridium estertheticum]MBU3179077.1 hypothetical protein [Clostridium estertheticum]
MFINTLLAAIPIDKQLKHVPIVKNMYDASNTPLKPIFDTTKITFLDKAEHFFNTTDKIINLIAHPILIVNGLAGASFYIAASVGITGLIFYIIGYKKGMKYVVGSLVGYTLIQILNYGVDLLC